jgi:hypothetical protein
MNKKMKAMPREQIHFEEYGVKDEIESFIDPRFIAESK